MCPSVFSCILMIANPKLYKEVKEEADRIYKKPSAYKSGFIVKEYKRRGGTYTGAYPINKGLDRWYKEEWKDVGHSLAKLENLHSPTSLENGHLAYPVYRPSIRITRDTPLLPNEIQKNNLHQQIKLKQKVKGNKNLPPFKAK